jgi:thymidylate synthase (FAD)
VARQWIRHRTGSFNEMSARYGVMPDEFYVPKLDRMASQSKSNKQGSGDVLPDREAIACRNIIRESAQDAYEAYEQMLEMGLARELARSVLPVAMYTQWYWTTDLHNLMHFLRLRLHSHAQHEIRVYGEAIRELVRPVAPFTMRVFDESLGAA